VEEFVHLRNFVGNILETGVHVVDQEEGVDGSLIRRERLEGIDGARVLVVEDGKILLLEASDGRTGLGSDHYVEKNAIIMSIRRGTSGLLGGGRKIAEQGREKEQADT